MFSRLLSEALDISVPWDDEPLGEARRRGRVYPGLYGGEHDAAMKKGYVDLGLIDPDRARELGPEKMLGILERHVTTLLMKKDVGFIRDPEGIVRAIGLDTRRLGTLVVGALADHFAEERSYASEREDQQDEIMLSKAEQAMRQATASIVPVRGQTGEGYKIVVKPTFSSIEGRL